MKLESVQTRIDYQVKKAPHDAPDNGIGMTAADSQSKEHGEKYNGVRPEQYLRHVKGSGEKAHRVGDDNVTKHILKHGIVREGTREDICSVKSSAEVRQRYALRSGLIKPPSRAEDDQSPLAITFRRTQSLPNVRSARSKDTDSRASAQGLGLESFGTNPISKLPELVQRPKDYQYDIDKANTFATDLVSAVNDGSICLLVSLGHQLGLFAVMAKLNDRPRSSKSLAAAANNLRPRYVQELLSAMTCAGIVEESYHPAPSLRNSTNPMVKATYQLMNPHSGSTSDGPTVAGNAAGNVAGMAAFPFRKYRLPREHALFLTWNSGQDNLALLAQYVPVLARIEDEVVECFRTGKGLDWTRYGQFDLVSELDTNQTLGSIKKFESEILGIVPGLSQALRVGTSVLCLGSGLGSTFANLALYFPKSWFTIYETNPQKAAVAASTHDAVPNLHFRSLGDTIRTEPEIMEERKTYSAAFILDGSVVRDAFAPNELLQKVHSALRPRCPLIYFEYNLQKGRQMSPAGPLLHGISTLQSVPLGVMAGGPALGRIWGASKAGKALEEAGFTDVEFHRRDGDAMNIILVATSEVRERNVQ